MTWALQFAAMGLNRRSFLKRVGAAQAGALLSTAAAQRPRPSADVVVIGAGAFGGWTAYYLRQLGASVRLVDAYGPGNSRATSGDETRGVRSSYGDRARVRSCGPPVPPCIDRCTTFDEEWGRRMKVRLFFKTGDLIFRQGPETFTERTQDMWTRLNIPFQVVSVDDMARKYPVFNLAKVGFGLYDPRAGVVRARRACEVVAEAFRQSGGRVLMGYAALGDRDAARLQNIRTTGPAATLTAGTFVLAVGPWFPKLLPEMMASRMRTPLGHVHYLARRPATTGSRSESPKLQFSGVTGGLRSAGQPGFRAMRGSALVDPDTSDRAFDRSHDALGADVPRRSLSSTRQCAAARNSRLSLRHQHVGQLHHRQAPRLQQRLDCRRRQRRRLQIRAGRR